MRKGVPSGRDFRERLARTPSRVSSEVFDSSSILKSLVPHREEISSEESECDVFFRSVTAGDKNSNVTMKRRRKKKLKLLSWKI
jgi:hypothetical protein